MAFNTVSSAPYVPTTTNDHTGHNAAVAAYATAINNHNHDPSSSTGNYGNSVPAWGSANPIYTAHGPGGAGSDWASAFNGAAAIPADPTETAVNPSTNATIAQGTPGASITASWGVHGELARIRGALALMKGASANWFDAVALFVDPSSQAGDLIYRNGSNVSTALHVGTNGMVLGLVAGLPAWITNPAGFADPTTTAGDLIYKNGTAVTTRLPVGPNGQLLQAISGVPGYAALTASQLPVALTAAVGAVQIDTTPGAGNPIAITQATYPNGVAALTPASQQTGSVNVSGNLSTGAKHVTTGTTAPSWAAGTGLGTTPPAPVFAAGSNDQDGAFTFGTGTVPTSGGKIATITFTSAWPKTPRIVFAEGNAATAALANGFYVTNESTTGFDVLYSGALAASQANTVYSLKYVCLG